MWSLETEIFRPEDFGLLLHGYDSRALYIGFQDFARTVFDFTDKDFGLWLRGSRVEVSRL